MAIDTQWILEQLALEDAGKPPEGYVVEPSARRDCWVWRSMIDGVSRSATASDEVTCVAAAWANFWGQTFGRLPPGYTVERDSEGWTWAIAGHGVKSTPHMASEQAEAEAWDDFKAQLTGHQRPPHALASYSLEALQTAYVEKSLEVVDVLVMADDLKVRQSRLVREVQKIREEISLRAKRRA